MARYSPRVEFAAVLTDAVRLKPRIFRGAEITWRHLAASCAIPGVMRHYRIGGRWYTDGGLIESAAGLGGSGAGGDADLALNALPKIPSALLAPFVKGFRRVAGHHPPIADGVQVVTLETDGCARCRRWGGITLAAG